MQALQMCLRNIFLTGFILFFLLLSSQMIRAHRKNQ
jgi:hypothetical protein